MWLRRSNQVSLRADALADFHSFCRATSYGLRYFGWLASDVGLYAAIIPLIADPRNRSTSCDWTCGVGPFDRWSYRQHSGHDSKNI